MRVTLANINSKKHYASILILTMLSGNGLFKICPKQICDVTRFFEEKWNAIHMIFSKIAV